MTTMELRLQMCMIWRKKSGVFEGVGEMRSIENRVLGLGGIFSLS